MTNYSTIRYQPPAASTTVVSDMNALIALSGMSNGDQVLVQSNLNLYMYSGSGFYKIATILNDSPSAITGVDGTYALAIDGSPTTITAVSTDPEGFPLTWSYTTSGLGSIATVSHTNGVFTITPSTVEANAGTFTLTISATDGVNGAVNATSSITLEFIVTITNSRYTTFLTTATSTGDNNDITDSSSSNHTITVNGDAHAGAFSPYRHGGYSVEFDGNDSFYVDGTAIGTNAFTYDVWIRPSDRANYRSFGAFRQSAASNGTSFTFGTNSSGQIYLYDTAFEATSTTIIPINAWTHFCCTRASNGTLKFYINGSLETITTQNGTTATEVTNTVNIQDARYNVGGHAYDSYFYQGEIRDYRLIIGSAIAPDSGGPNEPLTSPTGTELLLCATPYLGDKNTQETPKILTIVGDPKTVPSSPYDNVEYDPTVHGGSFSFDGTSNGEVTIVGSGAAINTARSANAITFECWYYPLAQSGYDRIFGHSSPYNMGALFSFGGTPRFYDDGGYISGNPIPNNVWTHFAVTYNGSKTVLYQNGVNVAEETSPDFSGTDDISLGDSTYDLHGFVSDFRISDNVVYSSNFTPPTAPLSSTGSITHLKSTDASVVDKSQNANFSLSGATTDPVVSTAANDPFGGNDRPLFFDGGDILYATSATTINQNYVLGTGDFTIEKWIQFTSFGSGDRVLWDFRPLTTNGAYLNMYQNAGIIKVYVGAASANTLVAASALSLNTWHHIAVCRSGTSKKLFIDGNQSGSTYNDSIDYLCGNTSEPNRPVIGNIGYNTSYNGYGMTAYLYNFRISKGLARYTSNFSVPTEKFKG